MPFWHGLRIIWTVVRFRLDTIGAEFVEDHWLRWFLPAQYLPRPSKPGADRLRATLERLGPIFVKFGQILSTRRDLLPLDYATELAKLQDKVPPFPSDEAIECIEKSLNRSVDEVFASISHEPLASASLAQVHEAHLHDGSQVVIKVIRPGIEPGIKKDLALLFSVARLLERVSADARRLHLVEVVSDYERTIFNELDLELEGANTTQLRRNFAGSPLLYAPRVFADISTRSVLVMERIHGIPIADVDALRACGTDLKKLAIRGVETFFTQVFRHNFFHADMHPGNIFIDVADPSDPSYIAIDCAIIGQLTTEDQAYLARNILAFFNRDYAEIARLHAESGWIAPDTDVKGFENVIRELCDPLFEKPLAEISFANFLLSLFRTARQFHMEVQPQLVLLQKTLLNVEGLGKLLDPELDLWATAKPFMEKWMADQYGLTATIKDLLDRGPELLSKLPRLPSLVLSAESNLSELRQSQRLHGHILQGLQDESAAQRKRRRVDRVIGAFLLLLGVTCIYATPYLGDFAFFERFGVPMSVALCVAGGVLLWRA